MGDFNQAKYIQEYQKENYDRCIFNVPKGKKKEIIEHYKKNGYESMNQYVNALIYQDMNGGGIEKELSENSPSAKCAEGKLSDNLSSANTDPVV